MNTMKRYIHATSLLVASGIILSACSHNEHTDDEKKGTPVTVAVSTASLESNVAVQCSGQIVAGETALISTRMMGFITAIKVKPGDPVKKGQLLVTISNGDILAKRAQAGAMVTEAEAALQDAQRDYERYTALYKQQSASQKELENMTLQYNALKAKTEAAREMQHEAEAMLTYANLTAPFAGVVTQKLADAGSMASPGIPILVIEQSGTFQVSTSVTEADIDRIKTGADATVVVESIGRTFTARVSEVSPSSHMSSGQYQVKLSIPENEKNSLHAGMYAKVSIASTPSGNAAQALMVPTGAIVSKDQLNGLYTISDNQTAILRWVKLGKQRGDQVEVLSGLAGDEKFILAADGKLYNGIPVIVK
jgi:RND family efflux transporter MFP subunit